MENNNWYNNNSNNYSYSSEGGYDNGKKKKGVTIGQLIACLLIVALVSGGLGVYFSDSIVNRSQAAPESDSIIVEEPGGPNNESDETVPEETDAAKPQQGSVSDKLTISGSDDEADSTTNIVQNCMASVVGIYVSEQTISMSGEATEQDTGSGSGVIITEDGYIVTNNHVVAGGGNLNVYLQDGTKYHATLIGTDSFSDLAVIKIDEKNLPAATLGNSANAMVGNTVYAIGNPLGVFTSSVSRGIISGLDRTINIDGVNMTLMQTDAAVNPGNSGGGLFNTEGELIGIVNAKTASVEVEGLGFAIPIDSARPVIVDIIDLGYVTGRPYIGISMQDVSLRYGNNSHGYGFFDPFSFYSSYITRVQVMAVEEGSAAEAGGMLVNDIITAVDGKEISGSSQFAALLYEYNVGDTVTITVLRGNETKDLTIVLGERS